MKQRMLPLILSSVLLAAAPSLALAQSGQAATRPRARRASWCWTTPSAC